MRGGRRVLLTRRWPKVVARLAAAGIEVVEAPAIEIRPPSDAGALDRALSDLDQYDWVVFTSAHAVEALAGAMAAQGLALPSRSRLAAVGPATTQAVATAWPGRPVAVQPEADFRGALLVEAFAGQDLADRRVLLPVSDRALETVEKGLLRRGARVDRVVAYRTVPAPSAAVLDALRTGVDAIAFASPSAVDATSSVAGDLARAVPAVTIGPTTAEAARAAGFKVVAVARPSTAEGLCQALVGLWPRGRPRDSRP